MRNKKADLSMNMIIVAAIAIIVLLVVVMMFSGKMGTFGRTMQSCDAQGGVCTSTASADTDCTEFGIGCTEHCPNPDNSVVLKGTDCEKDANGQKTQKICCKSII